MWSALLALAEPTADLPPRAMLQTALALLLTGLLAALVLRLLRPRLPRARDGAPLQLVARLPLADGQALYLARVAGRYLLLGGASGGLSLLKELEPGEVEGYLLQEAAAVPPSGRLRWLHKAASALRGRS